MRTAHHSVQSAGNGWHKANDIRQMNPMVLNDISILLVEKFDQAGHGTATVANAVLFFGRHLGKCTAVTFNWLENTVIAESSCTVAFGKDNSLDLALKQVHFLTLQQGYSRAETGCTLGYPLKFLQYLIDVGLAIMPWSGIARRVNTGFTIQGINLKSGIVAKAVITIMLLDIKCLHFGISFDKIGGFGYIFMATNVGKTKYFVAFTYHLTQFLELVRIVRRKN